MALIHYKNENFDEIIKNGVTVVDFFANWCGPCKMLSPIIERVANDIKDINFVKIDVDKNEDLARRYSIMSIPTIIMFKNGEIILKHVGFISEEKIKEILSNI